MSARRHDRTQRRGGAIVTVLSCALLAAACAGGPGLQTAAEPAAFQYRLALEPGTTFRQLMTMEQSSATRVMETAQEMQQTISMVSRFEVLDVAADGSAELAVTYESVRARLDSPMGPIVYDSEAPPESLPLQARAFAAFAGHGFTMTLDADGSVRSVTGAERLYARFRESLGELADNLSESMLEDALGDDAYAAAMSSYYGVFPDRPVHVGESWTRSRSIETLMPMTSEANWSLRERRDGVAYLDMTATVASGDDASTSMGAMTMHYDLTGAQSGTAEVDEATGWMRRMRMESTIEGSMRMESGPIGAMQAPMSARHVVTIEPFVDG